MFPFLNVFDWPKHSRHNYQMSQQSPSQRARTPIEVLRDTLTTGFGAPNDATHDQPLPKALQLRVIGRDTCGTIHTSANPSMVAYKIGCDRAALWNDIHLTARVHASTRDANVLPLPRVPAIKGWRDKIEHASLFEGDIHAGSYLFGLQLCPAKHVRLYYRSMSSPRRRPKRLRTRKTTSVSYGPISD
jgi:hypothetical protein